MNTSSENIYKCLFYGILFIFLIIILLLLLNKKKENKEKYTCNPSISITPANSSNIIQVDPSTGDLSEINTNSILNAVNSIIDCYVNKNTIFNNITVNTNATISSANITGVFTSTATADNNNIFQGPVRFQNTSNITTTFINSTCNITPGPIPTEDMFRSYLANGQSWFYFNNYAGFGLYDSPSNTQFWVFNTNGMTMNRGAITVNSSLQSGNYSGTAVYYLNCLQSTGQCSGNKPNTGSYSDTVGDFIQYGVYCQYNVLALGFVSFSDERVKNNITDIDNKNALDIIRKIKPKKYNYKDIGKCNKPKFGFIAQEVKSVLDYSTSLTKDFIPDINELAEVLDSNTIKLNTKTTIDFEVNKRIRFILLDGAYLDTNINGILDINTFTVEENILQEQIFVYGREVDDFHVLDTDVIFTVATSALQQVDKELQNEKVLIQQLENKIITLTGSVEELYKIIEQQSNDIRQLYNNQNSFIKKQNY